MTNAPETITLLEHEVDKLEDICGRLMRMDVPTETRMIAIEHLDGARRVLLDAAAVMRGSE